MTNILWHFTKAEKLESILANGLYATQATMLSDGTECLIRRKILTAMSSCVQMALGEDAVSACVNWKKIEDNIGAGNVYSPYITCFSARPVFDYMWERFSQDVSKDSVAIGFDRNAIEKTAIGSNGVLKQCEYHSFDKELKRAEQLSSGVKKLCGILKPRTIKRRQIQYANGLMRQLKIAATEAAFAKRDIFILEQETRLLLLPRPEEKKRLTVDGNDKRIYVKFAGSSADYVMRILVWNGTHAEVDLKSILETIQKFGIPKDRVEPFEQSEFVRERDLSGRSDIRNEFEKCSCPKEGERK